MNWTKLSLANPAAVAAAAAIVVVFGLIALADMPIQMLPNVERPTITIFNNWRAAAPEEVEEAMIEPQETVLRGTPGMIELDSFVSRGFGRIRLSFDVGTDMNTALLEVVNRVNRADPPPADADKPFITLGDGWNGGGAQAASMLLYPLDDAPVTDMVHYHQFVSDVVEPKLAAIAGVASVNLQGNRPKELQIRFDPFRLAALGISVNEVSNAVSRAVDISAGFASVGRRQYTVRLTGKQSPEALGELIVGWSEDRPIYLREVAEVKIDYIERNGFTYRNGEPGYYITLTAAPGSNTVAIIDQLHGVLDELNNGVLAERGLYLEQSWDASIYIRRAIQMVQGSLGLGILLAVGGLWFFLRGMRATLVVALSIPISIACALIVLKFTGRSLNVVSLAGMAFAVGMVLDAAIIVQENIVRLFQKGEGEAKAAHDGAVRVAPALFASTVTSIAIFVPVLFMPGLEGQLFADLAIAMSVALAASLVVALTVIPLTARFALKHGLPEDNHAHWWDAITRTALKLTDRAWARGLWIAGLVGGASAFTVVMAPKFDYLPVAQTDLLWTNFILPPGGNIETLDKEWAGTIISRMEPHLKGEKQPAVRGYNLSAFGSAFSVLAIYPQDPEQMKELQKIVQEEITADLPDARAFVSRGSLLNIGGQNAREIALDLQGSDIEGLMNAARAGMGAIGEAFPGTYARPVPGVDMAEPELALQPREWEITRAGLDRFAVGSAVRAFTDGLFVGEYFDGDQRMNIILRGTPWDSPEALAELPLVTPGAGVVTIGELADIHRTVGPTQLQRINGRRTISLTFQPPEDMTLDEALNILRELVEPKLREVLPTGATIAYRGSANELHSALAQIGKNFALALLILFAVMAALFRSVRDSLLVMLLMPSALAGGIAALNIMGLFRFQALDLLTMIGFIILLGLVVNNSILLVDQTRQAEREGARRRDAVESALRMRARPIVLSTLTSVLGMLPLMLLPGVGTEIYRGLAAVIVGGMSIGALFSLILMPALLRLGEGAQSVSLAPATPLKDASA